MPFFEVQYGPSGPSVTYGMRSLSAADALVVNRSGGIQGMSMWQSAEIRVYRIGVSLKRMPRWYPPDATEARSPAGMAAVRYTPRETRTRHRARHADGALGARTT